MNEARRSLRFEKGFDGNTIATFGGRMGRRVVRKRSSRSGSCDRRPDPRTPGLTLHQVATKAGISVGYLSQIERNQSKLPIGVLRKLSNVLRVHMNWFFQGNANSAPEERDLIVRKAHRRKLTFTGFGIVEELLSPNLSGPLELLLSTVEPGADSGDYSHDGAEAGVVISGTLDLWIGGQFFRLEEGDSFAFSSNSVHRCGNPGKVATKVIWVITPPHY